MVIILLIAISLLYIMDLRSKLLKEIIVKEEPEIKDCESNKTDNFLDATRLPLRTMVTEYLAVYLQF